MCTRRAVPHGVCYKSLSVTLQSHRMTSYKLVPPAVNRGTHLNPRVELHVRETALQHVSSHPHDAMLLPGRPPSNMAVTLTYVPTFIHFSKC